jgi:putative membrane protein
MGRDSGVSETKAGHSLAKGLIAGLVAGLVATAAKSCVEAVFPPRVHGEPEPPEALAEKIAGHHLNRKTKTAAGTAIHSGFGAAVGAAYGAVAEYYPAATDKQGATFGLTLMSLTHETSLPAMELAEAVEGQSFRERSSEATSHLVYGLVAERVRSVVRSML